MKKPYLEEGKIFKQLRVKSKLSVKQFCLCLGLAEITYYHNIAGYKKISKSHIHLALLLVNIPETIFFFQKTYKDKWGKIKKYSTKTKLED